MDVEGMKNARLGVVYLWQGTKMESALASTIVSGVFSGATNCMSIPPDINIHSHDDIAGLLGEASSGGAQGAWAQFKAWAEDFCRKMWAKIRIGILGKDDERRLARMDARTMEGMSTCSGGMIRGWWIMAIRFPRRAEGDNFIYTKDLFAQVCAPFIPSLYAMLVSRRGKMT